MKILLLGHDFAVSGGVGKYLNRLTRALIAAGHSVGAVQSLGFDPSSWPEGAPLWTVPRFDAYDARVRPGAASQVLRLVDDFRPDVVHVHDGSNFALEEAIRSRVVAIKTLHTLDFCPTGSRYHYTTRRLCTHRVGWMCLPRIAYKRCMLSKRPTVWWHVVRRTLASRAHTPGYRAVVVTSQYVRRFVTSEGLADGQVHVVPYFAELPLEPAPLPELPRILFAGRVYPEKGLDLLLRAAARLGPRAFALDVVGDGPGVPPARRLAERLGIGPQLTFHGWQPEMDSYYRRASVVVVPSRLAEPFGIVGIEAMSHARPVVAFAVGGVPDWLEDGVTGLLAPPHDVEAMGARLATLVDAPDLARRMGEAGRARARAHFTIDAHVEALVEIYRRVARG